MSKLTFAVVALAALVSIDAHAKNRFGRRTYRPSAPRNPMTSPVAQVPASILNDPVKMTERYGPSILIRETATSPAPSRFVTQPE